MLRVSRNMPDFEVYWTGAGRAARAEPLYRAEDQHYQFKYLPAFAVLTIPLSFMPLPVAKGVWFANSVALLVLLVAMSIRLLPNRRKPTTLLAVIVIVVLGKFFARELLLGQVNVWFAVIATSAFLAMKAGREMLAGSLVAFTIAIKPYGIILVPWLIARKKAGSVLAVGLAGAVVCLLPAVLYGIEGTIALYRAWWDTVIDSTAPNLLNPDNVSLASMYAKWLGPGRLAAWLALITALTLVGSAVLVFLRRRAVTFPEGLEGSLLLTFVPLLSPQGWDYALLVATPAIMYLAKLRGSASDHPETVCSSGRLDDGTEPVRPHGTDRLRCLHGRSRHQCVRSNTRRRAVCAETEEDSLAWTSGILRLKAANMEQGGKGHEDRQGNQCVGVGGLADRVGRTVARRPGEDAGTPRHVGNGPPGIDRSS